LLESGQINEDQYNRYLFGSSGERNRIVREALGYETEREDTSRYTPAPAPVPMSAQPETLEDLATAATPPTTPPRPGGEKDKAGETGGESGGPGGGTGGRGRGLDTDRMLEQDKWLALAQFGLGLMASQAPTLGGAIGEAGTAALGQLGKARQAAVERDLAERTLAARTAGSKRDSFPAAGANMLNSRIEALQERLASPMIAQNPTLRDTLQTELDTLLAQSQLLQAAYLSQYGLSGVLGVSAPQGDLSTVRADVSDQ
jgi:hypothetical protein